MKLKLSKPCDSYLLMAIQHQLWTLLATVSNDSIGRSAVKVTYKREDWHMKKHDT